MLALLITAALAGTPTEVVQPERVTEPGGLTFLGYVQSRVTLTSIETTSPFLDGQVIGKLGGLNGTKASNEHTASLTEFRTNGLFTYAPVALNGRAELTAGFEIDYGFGDQSYATGGNTGGGFGADQVNLQTRRLHATFRPHLDGGHSVAIVVGLQFVGDSVYEPGTSRPDDLFRTGGGLKFFGSEAAGISAYGRLADGWGERIRWRAGWYTLYEQGASINDDVGLFMADGQWTPEYGFRLGAHAWYLRDRAGGTAGLGLGSGATSPLSELQGGPRLDFRDDPLGAAPEVNADLFWLMVDGGYNHALDHGPVGVNAAVAANLGGFYVTGLPDDTGIGWLANAEGRYRWAAGDGSVARAELLYTTNDDPGIAGYGGVITGNSYGVVGASWATQGTYLLFPDMGAINRQVAVVSDVSNGGQGLVALSSSFGWDIVPNRSGVTLGMAHARSGTSDVLGTELNARLRLRPLPLLDVGLAGAAVLASDQQALPWTAVATLDWVVF